MKLKEMLETLRTVSNLIEIRDEDNYEIATFPQGSSGLVRYEGKEVISWFPGAAPFKDATFTVQIKE